MAILVFLKFVLVGILSNAGWGLLFVSFNVSLWKKVVLREKDETFSTATFLWVQATRWMFGCIISFFIWDVALNEHTVAAFFDTFGIWLVIIQGAEFLFMNRFSRVIFTGTIVLLLVTIGGWCVGFTQYETFYHMAQTHTTVENKVPDEINNLGTIPLINGSSAQYKIDKLSGRLTNTSWFEEGDYRIQKVGNQLQYVAPYEFSSLFKAFKAKQTPGYASVSVTDPDADAIIYNSKLVYIDSAYFDKNLMRHVRNEYPSLVLFETNLEPDDKGYPYYVVSYGHYKLWRSGPVLDGVIVVDPKTGEMKKYPKGSEPKWVDLVFTKSIAADYFTYIGEYVHGFWNTHIGQKDMHTPNDIRTTFNEKGELIYTVDFTRPNGSGKSMSRFGVMNAKTGEITIYPKVNGVLTGDEAVKAVNQSEMVVRNKTWKGSYPTYYTIYGSPSFVIPVYDGNNMYQGVAVVRADSSKVLVAFGNTKEEAFDDYKRKLASIHKGNIAPTKDSKKVTLQGTVFRINPYIDKDGTVYYVLLQGQTKAFLVSPTVSKEIINTEKGDTVQLSYYETNEDTVAIQSFDNTAIQ
ncbi:hypothetical protein [Ectobacillus panaciterrae]|uniref:hypothetical protein n=1 Tax=Ectobacillus panaciterrae TaxID=363872 RepID=UPI0003FD36CC|nr:hypothetical protein [Ectobacillus panaciterrae]